MAGATPSHPSDLRIVLLGKNGAEIRAVGNMILGREAFKEKSRESEVQRGRVEDRNISVIDTPGFFNPELTDEDLQNEMMKSLSLSHPGPHVFLMIVSPDTFTEDDVRKIVQKINEKFGVHVFRFTRVLFIRENMSNRDWIEFSLTKKFKELISHFKSKYYVINSESETITRLLEKINDMVKQNDNQHYIIDNYVKFIPKTKQEVEEKVQVMQTDPRLSLTPQVTSPVTRQHENPPQLRPRDRRLPSTPQVTSPVTRQHENQPQTKHQDRRLPLTPPVTSPVHEKHENKVFGVIHQPQTRPQDLRIVMFGTSGNGKSATGNTILGMDLFKVEMSCESVTTLSETHQNTVDGRNISVTDNPGLFDTSMTTEHLNSEIVKCLYMSAPGPHVFLLIIRLDVRFTEEMNDTVKWIQEVFSEDAINYTMVLFTRGDQLEEPIEGFLKRNKPLRDLVDRCKAGYHVFNNKDRNQRQVTELFEKIDRLVERNGGEHYTNELYQEAQRKVDKEQARRKEHRKSESQRTTEEQRCREEELRNLEKEHRKSETQRTTEEQRCREEELRNLEKEHRKSETQRTTEEQRCREEELRNLEKTLRKSETQRTTEEQRCREEELRNLEKTLRKSETQRTTEEQRCREEELRNLEKTLRKSETQRTTEEQRCREEELRNLEKTLRKSETQRTTEEQRCREEELRNLEKTLRKSETQRTTEEQRCREEELRNLEKTLRKSETQRTTEEQRCREEELRNLEKTLRKSETQRTTEEQRCREEELRNLEKTLRNREEQVKNREQQLRQKEEEQRKREEEKKLRRISAETRASELVRRMSVRRKAVLAALIAASAVSEK